MNTVEWDLPILIWKDWNFSIDWLHYQLKQTWIQFQNQIQKWLRRNRFLIQQQPAYTTIWGVEWGLRKGRSTLKMIKLFFDDFVSFIKLNSLFFLAFSIFRVGWIHLGVRCWIELNKITHTAWLHLVFNNASNNSKKINFYYSFFGLPLMQKKYYFKTWWVAEWELRGLYLSIIQLEIKPLQLIFLSFIIFSHDRAKW